jgi:hypothetical protein
LATGNFVLRLAADGPGFLFVAIRLCRLLTDAFFGAMPTGF